MTEPRRAAGRWPVVTAVAPAAALLFSGAAAWASLTAPEPWQAPPKVASAAEPVEVAAPDPTAARRIAALRARLEADQRRLSALRKRISSSRAGSGAAAAPKAVAGAPRARAPKAAAPAPARPQAAKPRPAAPPPPADTSTGASG